VKMVTAKLVASTLFAFRSSVPRRVLSLIIATHLAAVLALTGCGSSPYTPPNSAPPAFRNERRDVPFPARVRWLFTSAFGAGLPAVSGFLVMTLGG